MHEPFEPLPGIEIFLQPGEVYFGDRNTRIRTLLGSCVAVVMWHPERLLGGMCHYMLPTCRGQIHHAPDGHYADEAMELMMREIRNAGTRPGEYRVKLFGGGKMFATQVCEEHVGEKNIEIARVLMKQYGFTVCSEYLGGVGYITILFDIWSGNVWVRQQAAESGRHSGTICAQ